MNAKIIVVYTQKGGVGKTGLSMVLGVELSAINSKNQVLLIDADPQASLSYALLGRSPAPTDDSLYSQIVKYENINEPVKPAKVEQLKDNLFLLPGNSNTCDLSEMIGFAEKCANPQTSVFNVFTGRLYHAIQTTCLEYKITHVVIDTNPVKDVLNRRLIGLADFVVSPIRCDQLSRWAVNDWEILFQRCQEEVTMASQSANLTAYTIPTTSKAKFVGYVIQSEIDQQIDFYRAQATRMGGNVFFGEMDKLLDIFR